MGKNKQNQVTLDLDSDKTYIVVYSPDHDEWAVKTMTAREIHQEFYDILAYIYIIDGTIISPEDHVPKFHRKGTIIK